MNIAFVSSEVYPYIKTGGLADVAGALPIALDKLGCNVKIFVPKYSSVDEEKFNLHYNWTIGEMQIRINEHIRSVHLHHCKHLNTNIEVIFIDCPHYYYRGQVYTNSPDEDERFILFSKAVIEAIQRLDWVPDVIHCNDWQTGLLPLFIKDNYSWDKKFEKTATVFTIHNIGYQGKYSTSSLFKAEISGGHFYPMGPVEYEGGVSFMKAGISFADIVNTVSKTYAEEVLTPQYGEGMQGVLNERKDSFYGILNGIDYDVWSPETDKHIPFNYSIDTIEEKIKNKKFLCEKFNLPFNPEVPLIGIISRLAIQKGFDIFTEASHRLMQLNAQWVVLGSGEEYYEEMFRYLSHTHRDKIFTYIGYNNELSHLIEAASDIFLMPSKYEPCGLNQIYSLKYGTVPVVRNTGGLADTVKDWHKLNYTGDESGTGFSFDDYTSNALTITVQRAIETYKDKNVWKKLISNGMKKEFSWENSAKEYIELYEKAKANRK